jgi:transketolase
LDLEELCINTIRSLTLDMVQQANSGHLGTPMRVAPTAYVLWDRFLNHNLSDPKWPDRDRFALSVGWERNVGLYGSTIGISRSGAAAPGNIVYEKLGLTVQPIVDEASKLSQRS